jgi:hypothetical protein
MEANNAGSEQVVETNQAVNTDTLSTTDSNAIEAGDTATGEQSSSVESSNQEASVEESIYQIGDKEITLSRLAELEKGELLQSDYTKKSQLNAQSKKDLEAKHVLADENSKRLLDTISKLEGSIKAELDSEELEELRDTDIAEFTRRKEALAAKSEQAKQAKKDFEAKQAEENQERALVERELLISSQPTWSDPKVMEADISLIEKFVTTLELSDKDFNSLGSHKLMNMALSAAKYEQLQSSAEETEKQIQKAPNVIKATVKQSTPKLSRADRFYGKKKA